MSDRVFAITSVYEDHGLLPHFLEHYSRLGVRRILVVVRTPARDTLFAGAHEVASEWPADVFWVGCDRFADDEKAGVEEAVLRDNGVGADDLVMRLDLDEFHEYPAPLGEIVAALGRRRDRAVRGRLVDRVADDGTISPVRPAPDLGAQFPIGCDLTGRILGGWTQKVMLCRASARLRCGVNHDVLNASYEPVPVGSEDAYVVHHFKWTDGVAVRLQARLDSAALGSQYRQECRRFLDSVRETGRIDLADPLLCARRLGMLPYPG